MTSEIHIIGANGFIGKAIRNVGIKKTLNLKFWSHQSPNNEYYFDLFDKTTWYSLINSKPKILILISWPNLPNYNKRLHMTENLPTMISLIDSLEYLKKVLVAGTCYEYGDASGLLSENLPTRPNTIYGLSKDSLRRYLDIHSKTNSYDFIWGRIFYPYGQHQNKNSLFPSLIRAIQSNSQSFPMGSGTQIRDFINVKTVAEIILYLVLHHDAQGIYNIGSGQPHQLKDIVSRITLLMESEIKINYGSYPDRNSEPKEFWADISRIQSLGFVFPELNLAEDIIKEFDPLLC